MQQQSKKRKRSRAVNRQLEPGGATDDGYNGGLLCCAHINNQLHILCGSEFRNASRLTESQRQETSHRREKRLLQLVVPGGRHKRGESAVDTAIREFWEETGQIVDRMALLQCIYDRARIFQFDNSLYQLIVVPDAVQTSLPQVFSARVIEYGYPSECLRQLYWVPWRVARNVAKNRQTLSLNNDLEPHACRVAFSGFTASIIAHDRRVVAYLDALDQQQPSAATATAAAAAATAAAATAAAAETARKDDFLQHGTKRARTDLPFSATSACSSASA